MKFNLYCAMHGYKCRFQNIWHLVKIVFDQCQSDGYISKIVIACKHGVLSFTDYNIIGLLWGVRKNHKEHKQILNVHCSQALGLVWETVTLWWTQPHGSGVLKKKIFVSYVLLRNRASA